MYLLIFYLIASSVTEGSGQITGKREAALLQRKDVPRRGVGKCQRQPRIETRARA